MGAIYIGLIIDDMEREFLLNRFPPRHPNVYADHATLFFKPSEMAVKIAEERRGHPVDLFVLAEVFDEKGHALWLGCSYHDIDHSIVQQEFLHVTISCANGTSPVYSNTLLKKSWVDRFILHRFPGYLRVVRTEDREKYQMTDELCRRRGVPVPKRQ